MKKTLIVLIILFILQIPAICAEKKKLLTRGEVIDKISAADFLKKKIGDLLNWRTGYDITKINRTNLAPTIIYLKAKPNKIPPDNRTVLSLFVKISDPSGLDNIRGVRADLSEIKKLPNTILVDSGLWGDLNAGDGIYSLQTNVGYDVDQGDKEIPVAVSNKSGWVAVGRTTVDVKTDPLLSDAKADPQKVPADERTRVKLSVKVENPGRQEDVEEVIVDLTEIGGESKVNMNDNGEGGDIKANDMIYSVDTLVKENVRKGPKKLNIIATNRSKGKSGAEIILEVE